MSVLHVLFVLGTLLLYEVSGKRIIPRETNSPSRRLVNSPKRFIN